MSFSILARAGAAEHGPKAESLTGLTHPVTDWAALAKGFGVPACSVNTDNELADAIMRVLAERGANLIEAVLV